MILNLTQHPATPEQLEAGVVDLVGEEHEELRTLLTFESLPTSQEVYSRASAIVEIALRCFKRSDTPKDHRSAMIGGAPFLMTPLEGYLSDYRVTPVYAFSTRVSVEAVQDGVVVKQSQFKHMGFVDLT